MTNEVEDVNTIKKVKNYRVLLYFKIEINGLDFLSLKMHRIKSRLSSENVQKVYKFYDFNIFLIY